MMVKGAGNKMIFNNLTANDVFEEYINKRASASAQIKVISVNYQMNPPQFIINVEAEKANA